MEFMIEENQNQCHELKSIQNYNTSFINKIIIFPTVYLSK